MTRAFVLGLAVLVACGSSSPPSPPANKVDDKTDAQQRRELRDKVLGVNAHIVILKSATFADYRDVLATVERHPNVAAAEPFIFAELIGSAPNGTATPMVAKAVDPARVGKVLALGTSMTQGSIAVLAGSTAGPPPIVLGDVLAKKLGVKLGDEIQLTVPPSDPPLPRPARPSMFRVAGLFHIGFPEYDEKLSYTSLAAMQAFLDRGDTVMGVEAVVKDLATSEATARAIEKEIGGPPYRAMDWFELNQALFETRD